MYDGGKPSVEELIETKRKDLDKNIRLLNEEGYTVTLHYKKGKYYLKKQLKSEAGNDNKQRTEIRAGECKK